MREVVGVVKNPIVDDDLNYFKPQWRNFTLSELQAATNSFHQENLIGKGGYAEVYKGCLKSGQFVAIKWLTKGPQDERTGDFLSELGIMAHVNHPNTAKLIGYAVEGGHFLVLELSPNGSLANMFQMSKHKLDWKIRAMAHLTVSKFEGTFGLVYCLVLPHFRLLAAKVSNLMLILELITGRRALDFSQQSLVIWAKPLLKKNRIRELVDPLLADDYNLLQMNLMVLAASLCIHQSSIRRPRISNRGSLDIIRRCRKSSHWTRHYEELFSAEECKMIRGLSGLRMQEQIPIEV
ncbi:hypothetical protein RND71_006976 [Anisodus tanguticus]|uniref:Protein kinase domain-containing protein n=1 Tax=Anisodus tanguticus TaxID=243964 RepID=A0AAE1VW28_9SOLA|nr:hypothetical protein RND71_006976 [Anisodus tanguticus]